MSKLAREFDHLPQDSEMVAMLQSMDWSSTSLGPPSTWPEVLRLQLNICFESAFPIAIWWGPDLIQFYNDGYRPILGATKHPKAFGSPALDTWPDIWPTIGPMVDQVVKQGIAVKGEDMPLVLDRNGYLELCHFTFSYSPIRNIHGQIDGMFTAAVETSERVRAERRTAFQLMLADSLRGLSSPADIVATATELLCRHLQVARAFYAEIDDKASTFSIPSRWAQGTGLPQLPTHGVIDEFSPYLLKTLRQGQAVVVDELSADARFTGFGELYKALAISAIVIVPLIRNDQLRGNFNVAHDSARQWTAEDLAVISDVAERTWDAVERARAEETLRASNQRQTEFLSTLAHELRNPLAPIRSGLTVLAMKGDSVDAVAKVRGVLERQVSYMVTLIDDLLDVARITGGKLVLRKATADLKQALSNAVEVSLPNIEAGQHQLHLDLPEKAVLADIDATRIAQVVGNLLNNAAKYTPRGGKIELALRREDDVAVIAVTDNGIGIPDDAITSVFEMFSQIRHGLDRSQGGLGIGLSLVRRLVEMHGGSVSASSAGIGSGTTFSIRLPLVQQTVDAVEPVTRQVPDHVCGAGGVKLAILVVDDNVDAATTLSMLLEMHGHLVRMAHDGVEALDELRRFSPQLVFLDIGMPRMNGYEAARAIRQEDKGKDACLVALTGWGAENDRLQATAAGFDFHLMKPVQAGDIERILASFIK